VLESNSRIENLNGVRFYEQDILFDDYDYTGDMKIILNADYISPGIGITLVNSEGLYMESKREVYLFKIGYKSISVIYRLDDTQQELVRASINLAPIHENIVINFSKIGKKITIAVDGYGTILDYTLQTRLDQFNLGIYSNAGNTVNNVTIFSSVPNKWMVNMKNTNGGHIKFIGDGFELSECVGQAEIEQDNIPLTAGDYFLRYLQHAPGDVRPYIILSGDQRLSDDEKNMLDSNMNFTLKQDAKVNIKFKGKTGGIKDIFITDNYKDRYVPTDNDSVEIGGSYINVLLDGISEVSWSGLISDAPDEGPTDTYAIISDDVTDIKMGDINVVLGEEFQYRFTKESSLLEVSQNGEFVSSRILNDVNGTIAIFKNINAIISSFDLKQSDGEVINLIVEDTSKRYVPSDITSPIIVHDAQGIPFNLSSSYRIFSENGYDTYLFTNIEREVFNPTDLIKTENQFMRAPGSVIVYGIPEDAVISESNIFRILDKAMDSIDSYSDKYDTLHENDLKYIDYITGDIILRDPDKYKKIVVDYLKKDSYCINYIPDIDMYEVDISTDKVGTVIRYDHQLFNSNSAQSSSSYIMETLPQRDRYIVLRRSDFV
jgi:hypothetical protein